MLFAADPPETWIQAVAAVATALVGAWLTLRVRQIDASVRRWRRRARAERRRCDSLEVRVEELEKALGACLASKKPHRVNPRKSR